MKFDTADEWAKDINEAYDVFLKTGSARVEAIIKLGNKLIIMKDSLAPREWFFAFNAAKVEKPIMFSTSYAERLMEIARNPVLSNPDNRLHLPPTVSGLYALSRLDVEDPRLEYNSPFRYGKTYKTGPGTLARLMAEGHINSEMTVREIEQLLLRCSEGGDDEAAPVEANATSRPPKPRRRMTAAEVETESTVRHLEKRREALALREIGGVYVSPEAHCRLCSTGYRRPGGSYGDDQEDITAWIKQHVGECHAGQHVTVTFVVEQTPRTDEPALPAAPPATAQDDAAPAVNEAEETAAAEGDDEPKGEEEEEDEEDEQTAVPEHDCDWELAAGGGGYLCRICYKYKRHSWEVEAQPEP
jgi:hypothetical protein